ncbi:Hypothetical protein NTJ_05995 [Nesidiocoris tenuis]|uniref:Uncharacterized protein n=1 Tax=Nesidiocoris tenuis TaxID=355587 RepID=A0ABN7ALS7_9HEMI|nr:Hypothetical protein NTJ_05995 [Nesidiocoris tenuis]
MLFRASGLGYGDSSVPPPPAPPSPLPPSPLPPAPLLPPQVTRPSPVMRHRLFLPPLGSTIAYTSVRSPTARPQSLKRFRGVAVDRAHPYQLLSNRDWFFRSSRNAVLF